MKLSLTTFQRKIHSVVSDASKMFLLKYMFSEESDVEFDGFLPEVNDETDLDENQVDDDEDIQSRLSSSPIPGK